MSRIGRFPLKGTLVRNELHHHNQIDWVFENFYLGIY
jgi:hypothetical protein